ncbi:hypothetical protein KIS4809_1123 [Bacillus sp. ZZV12-4809]|nr:hypothetical protein KIS4809_1123 [Bacillus sp. ZZV12-4809]
MLNGALTPLLVLGLVLLWIVVRLISPSLADKIKGRICSLLDCLPAS